MKTTISMTFPTKQHLIDWLMERAGEKRVMADASSTLHKRRELLGEAWGIEFSADAIRDSNIGEA